MTNIICLHPNDNVAMAAQQIEQGDPIETGLVAAERIPAGHKVALRDLAKGDVILKYSQTIGWASANISAGEHIHTHNTEFRNLDGEYEFSTDLKPLRKLPPEQRDSFMGYSRENGSVGTRNYIAIITSVNCSATAARMIADAFGPQELMDYPNVDGVVAYVHGTGCGMADNGEGFDALQRVMWGYAKHANHAAVLMVGLGCEINQIDWLLEAHGLEQGKSFQCMNIQDVAGLSKTVEKGIEKVRAMLPEANRSVRTPSPASALTLGLQCGGSDAMSGVTANPALGYASDLLVAQGGTSVLSETPEIYGAEALLTRRAKDRKTGDKLLALLNWWEDYAARNHGNMDNNPSPGNKKGGITTILEKSLGAVAKGGTSRLNGVYKYGAPIDEAGLVFMDSPGYDPASVTGQIASGCNLIAFTTGRGSAFGSKPAPCIKIATNSGLFDRMHEDMDINAGSLLNNEQNLEQKGTEIYNLLLDVASGTPSKSEAQGLGDYEFVPWQIGAMM